MPNNPEPALAEKCENCRFFSANQKHPEDGGVCRRYPEVHHKYQYEWCGEYRPVQNERKKGGGRDAKV